MKPTLKILIGSALFLGIAATLVLLYIPDWMQASRVEHARQVVTSLTPEKVLARCGKPEEDTSATLEDGKTRRNIGYRVGAVGNHSQVVLLTFTRPAAGDWLLRSFRIGVDVAPSQAPVTKYDPEEELGFLPCLDPQRQ